MSIKGDFYRVFEKTKYYIDNNSLIKGKGFQEQDRDFQLLYDIQPTGGVKAFDRYVVLGDAYMSCIHIYSTPNKLIRNWLFRLCRYPNVITTVDIQTLDRNEVKENLNRSINEQESRMDDARKRSEFKESRKTRDKLDQLLDEVSELGNSVKSIHLRMYVYGRTFSELENNTRAIQKHIEEDGFSTYAININEQLNEFRALYSSPKTISMGLSDRKGLPCPSNVLAYGLPFHFVGWNDKNGFLLGDTPKTAGYGPVFFNQFLLDGKFRNSYDGFIVGDKGSGKSTTLKMLIENNIITGNKVRSIDVTGENNGVTKKYGGIIIKPDGGPDSDKLNPLEILRVDESEQQNYLSHISKMGLLYKLKSPSASEIVVSAFKNLLTKLYIKHGIINPDVDYDEQQITGLPPAAYPLFSDLLEMIDQEIELNEKAAKDKISVKYNIENLTVIRIQIEDIVINFGSIFNCHTTVKNMLDADIINFDLSNVAKDEPAVFDMQLFNVLSIAYDSCMTVGIKMKKAHDNGKISLDDVIHHVIYIDECHKTINTRKSYAVERIIDIMRQDRKYFIGVWLATQKITDMFPVSNNIAADEIKTIFSLCQYKMIFHQDSDGAKVCREAFGNMLTPYQIEIIPYLEKRQMLLNLGVNTLEVHCRKLSNDVLAYYGGGA